MIVCLPPATPAYQALTLFSEDCKAYLFTLSRSVCTGHQLPLTPEGIHVQFVIPIVQFFKCSTFWPHFGIIRSTQHRCSTNRCYASSVRKYVSRDHLGAHVKESFIEQATSVKSNSCLVTCTAPKQRRLSLIGRDDLFGLKQSSILYIMKSD